MACSVAALLSPALMQLTTRNLPRLQTGQWWRIFTPVLVQADGWGQLGFNLLGEPVRHRRLGAASPSSVPHWNAACPGPPGP